MFQSEMEFIYVSSEYIISIRREIFAEIISLYKPWRAHMYSH